MIRRNVDRLETRVMKKGDLREEIIRSPRTTSLTTAKPKPGDDQDGPVTPHPECTPCPSPKHQLSGSQRIPPKPGTAETAPSMLQPTSGCHARVVAQRSWQGRYLHVNAHHCARFNVQGLANSPRRQTGKPSNTTPYAEFPSSKTATVGVWMGRPSRVPTLWSPARHSIDISPRQFFFPGYCRSQCSL